MGPIDYMGSMPQIDLGQRFLSGLQAGAGIGQIENKALLQKQAQEQQAAYQADIANAFTKGDPQSFAALSLKYPAQREAIKQSWDQLSEGDRKAEGDTMAQAYSALLSGRDDIAAQAIERTRDARKNSGMDTSHYDSALELVKTDPKKALGTLGFTLSHINNPKDFAATFGALQKNDREEQLQPGAVRTANAKADVEVADATQKSLSAVGSALGALEGKNAKPEQVQTALKSLAARGIITKEELPDYLAAIPTDAKQRDEWLGSMRMAGMKPDDQMKYTTPDANAKLSSETQVKTTGMNNATQIKTTSMNNAVQRDIQASIDKRQAEKGNAEASLDDDSLKTMAAQYLAGDKSVMQNLGRGAQGSANIVALRKEISAQAKEKGMSGPQIAAAMADYSGLTAGIRTSAQISARVENAISEAKELAPLAIAASREVSRSGILAFGKAGIMFDTQTNNPALKKFVTANNGLVTAYGGAMARGQKPTVSDYEHAREILATAQSQEAYEATVNQMYAEMEAASRAPQNVREHLRGEIAGTNKAHAAPKAAPALPSGWTVKER